MERKLPQNPSSNNHQVPKEMQGQQITKQSPPANIIKKVAIVDDEKDIRSAMSLILRKAGHEVVISTANGEEIVDSIVNENPKREIDTILMDYSMQGMNGIEASRIIKNKKPGTKIIFVSAADIRDEVEDAGFAFIAKPFSIRKLLEVVAD